MATREKTSAEQRTFDFDFSRDLPPGVTLTAVNSLTASPVSNPPITFGTGLVNVAPISYPEDGHVAPIGTVVQVVIGGGLIPPSNRNQLFTLRCVCATSSGDVIEGIVRLLLNDTPPA